ncbi:EAL domain-containing protein [Sphingomonas sp. LY160]|uniref:EAL domain-containing protein n=1 Tax=Sphingomonas sp. LY160 TaxID=3095342 RepID=UPI002ADEEC88|nr:EAL domain-containing protein [Sphingomonas sp. LY160]MEA1071004.1 EAL domain-containing protein [Sphingomonas sp. LY160]
MNRQRADGTKRPVKLLAWAIVLGLIFGLIGFGEIAENGLRVARNRINEKPVSGNIVLVAIDERAMRQYEHWPWSRSLHAELVEKVSAAKPKRLGVDFLHVGKSDPVSDQRLIDAHAKARNDYIAMGDRLGMGDGEGEVAVPIVPLQKVTSLATVATNHNYANAVLSMRYSAKFEGRTVPTMASALAGIGGPVGGTFPINYSFDFHSIPRISAADILSGNFDPKAIEGKIAIIGPDSVRIGDQYLIPGYGRAGGVYHFIFAAETLMAGIPISLGWLPGYLLAVAGVLAVAMRRRAFGIGAFAATGTVLLVAPIFLEARQIFADVTPGLFVLLVVGGGLAWRYLAGRGVKNPITGLPNLNALKRARSERDRPLIAARVINYPEIASTLSIEQERSLVEQIVARLRVGSQSSTVYQGDEGIFAVTADPGTALGNHVEALAALFRSAAKVDGRRFDLVVTFGVEIGSGRSVANRLGSALSAADDAALEGLRWKYHDPERLKDVNWKLSLLSQLDQAVDNGEVWVAYQPQVELATGRIRGAEALARWTHPEKGPISPHEFITAAEQNDRIEKLTFFILNKAVEAAAEINRRQPGFDMAVNLSAKMLADRQLPSKVKAILGRHGLDPARLTLELTETAAIVGDGSGIEPLLRLRDLGVQISIDDYGTGMSTLEYLKKVPAGEIKIDQSFVKAMRDNRSDLVMVQSTIALAHSLGRTVVAEGVESREVLDLLVAMKCDFAQGFIIGRPSSFESLTRRLFARKGRHVA